jgi:hypothetical protein
MQAAMSLSGAVACAEQNWLMHCKRWGGGGGSVGRDGGGVDDMTGGRKSRRLRRQNSCFPCERNEGRGIAIGRSAACASVAMQPFQNYVAEFRFTVLYMTQKGTCPPFANLPHSACCYNFSLNFHFAVGRPLPPPVLLPFFFKRRRPPLCRML